MITQLIIFKFKLVKITDICFIWDQTFENHDG